MGNVAYNYLAAAFLSKLLGVPPIAWQRAILKGYRTKKIAKRSGGYRTIYIPAPELKELQRKILRIFLRRYALMRVTRPYGIAGESYIQHALYHEDAQWILKLDLKDAFPSTPIGLIRKALIKELIRSDPTLMLPEGLRASAQQNYKIYCVALADLILGLTTCDGILPQGAPTSPWLFGLVASHLLSDIWDCLPNGWQVTMYVDNIVISGPKPLFPEIEEDISNKIRQYGWQLNVKKRSLTPIRAGCQITGLSLIPGENGKSGTIGIPKKTRAKIRAIWHDALTDPGLVPRARGYIAYAASIYGKPYNFPPDILKPYMLLIAALESEDQ